METLSIVIIAILVIIICVLLYIIWNLNAKLSKYEDWILVLQENMVQAYTNLKTIDSRGSFEADDEVGYFFKFLKDCLKFLDDMT